MAVSRVVQARTRLRERRIEQQKALTAASRSADAVEAAQARRRELAEQGARLVADAEAAHNIAVVALVKAMGSVELAASVLDVDETVVRKAVARKASIRRPAGKSTRTLRVESANDQASTAPAIRSAASS